MLTALIAILGFAASLWNVSQPLRREELRTIAGKQSRWLTVLGVFAGVGLLAWLATSAWLALTQADPRACVARIDGCATGYLAVLAVWGWFIMQSKRWTVMSTAAFRGRLNHLLRSGHHSVVAGMIAKALPPGSPEGTIDRLALEPVIDRAFMAEGFAKTLVVEQPELAIEIMRTRHNVFVHHTDAILDAAFAMPPGALARELQLCTNYAPSGVGYQIPTDCILLHGLFDDCAVSERIHAWQPICQTLLRILKERQTGTANDPDSHHWDEQNGQWRSPIGVGLWYMRVMLTSALAQGTQYHMWLYYLPDFIREMLASNRLKIIDPDAEFPSAYHYLIYDCFDVLREVAELADKLPAGNPHRSRAASLQRDNSSIPISAVYAYARGICEIVMTTSLPQRYRDDRIKGAVDLYQTLQRSNAPSGIADTFAAALAECSQHAQFCALVDQLGRTEPHLPFAALAAEVRRLASGGRTIQQPA